MNTAAFSTRIGFPPQARGVLIPKTTKRSASGQNTPSIYRCLTPLGNDAHIAVSLGTQNQQPQVTIRLAARRYVHQPPRQRKAETEGFYNFSHVGFPHGEVLIPGTAERS